MSTGPQSSLSAPARYNSSNLVFTDKFSGTSLDNDWSPYITSNAANGWPWYDYGAGGSGMGDTYDAEEYFLLSQVSVNNGLTLRTVQQSITMARNELSQQPNQFLANALR
jgi:hypothetical protein